VEAEADGIEVEDLQRDIEVRRGEVANAAQDLVHRRHAPSFRAPR